MGSALTQTLVQLVIHVEMRFQPHHVKEIHACVLKTVQRPLIVHNLMKHVLPGQVLASPPVQLIPTANTCNKHATHLKDVSNKNARKTTIAELKIVTFYQVNAYNVKAQMNVQLGIAVIQLRTYNALTRARPTTTVYNLGKLAITLINVLRQSVLKTATELRLVSHVLKKTNAHSTLKNVISPIFDQSA